MNKVLPTYTPIPSNSPQPTSTITVTSSLTIYDYSKLPDHLKALLHLYDTFEELMEGLENNFGWRMGEANNLPPGFVSDSPSIFVNQATGECTELSYIYALFGV